MRIEERIIDVGTRQVSAELYLPAGAGPWPGVLLLHEIFGRTSQVRADARDLARAGFATLVPDLYSGGAVRYCLRVFFSADALANRAEAAPVREVGKLLDFLSQMPQCNGRLGMVGMCLSGGYVLQMARRDDVAAPVVFHHSFGVRDGGLPPADAGEIKHTVLGHFVERDPFCPRSRVAALGRRLGDKLDAHFYAGVGHGLRSQFRHTPQSALAWQRTLDFFAAHLAA